jgi:hypothetical protein
MTKTPTFLHPTQDIVPVNLILAIRLTLVNKIYIEELGLIEGRKFGNINNQSCSCKVVLRSFFEDELTYQF